MGNQSTVRAHVVRNAPLRVASCARYQLFDTMLVVPEQIDIVTKIGAT